MERDPQLVLRYMIEVEEMAEDVLTDKQQIVDLDRRRQKTREAIRALQKDKSSNKTWMCFGNMFLKFPQKDVKRMLDKDFDDLTNEMNKTRIGLKSKVEKLRDMEFKDKLKGFSLNPLSREDMRSIDDVL